MHSDLLQQAESLARLDLRGAPRQANLRRAVSSTYYALFQADYDLSERFQRFEVLALIQHVDQHIQEFSAVPQSNDRQFFLISLLTWKELANR